jgi:hypothetical protein
MKTMRSPSHKIISPRIRRSSWYQYSPSNSLQWVLVILMICTAQGFGKGARAHNISKRQKSLNGSARKGGSLPTSQGDSDGFFRVIWRRGLKRSISVASGVRSVCSLSRGGSTLSSMGNLDRWGRSLSLFLAWIVSVQSIGSALVVHHQSLFEVCFVSRYSCNFKSVVTHWPHSYYIIFS